MKKYLYCSRLPNGQMLHIGFYPDTPSKNYRIYLNGSDCGDRYEYLGNAERALKRIISAQIKNGLSGHVLSYATKQEIPVR